MWYARAPPRLANLRARALPETSKNALCANARRSIGWARQAAACEQEASAKRSCHWSHSSVGQSVRLITERSAVQARVGPLNCAATFCAESPFSLPTARGWRRTFAHPRNAREGSARDTAGGGRSRVRGHAGSATEKAEPPWPNGQGVGPLIRRLRVRVPQGVLLMQRHADEVSAPDTASLSSMVEV